MLCVAAGHPRAIMPPSSTPNTPQRKAADGGARAKVSRRDVIESWVNQSIGRRRIR